ncbi:hypothetical protein PVAP13_4KG380502 [Panicum virgatum]|uniref:Uncharacterized protein n=1 Tax=Panicum virgatum TaxID=38727 RepID=A0A8T0TYZ2_PANVG|nr:hypothetical protein PVAP13_4KG380502 [Panicum virgatum]
MRLREHYCLINVKAIIHDRTAQMTHANINYERKQQRKRRAVARICLIDMENVPPWLWPCSSRPSTQVVAARMRQRRSGTSAGAGKGAAMAGAEADSNLARPPTPMAVSRSTREPARLQAGAASGRHSRTSAPAACLCRGCGLAWPRVSTAHRLAWPQAALEGLCPANGPAQRLRSKVAWSSLYELP